MRKNTFFGAAALGIAGTFLAAGVANAGSFGNLSFDHNPVAPGDTVTIIGDCYDPHFTSATLRSAVLEPIVLTMKEKKDGSGHRDFGSPKTKVKKAAESGTYKVDFTCGPILVTAELTVVVKDSAKDGARDTRTPVTAKAPAPKTGQVAVKPKGAAETGGDGVVAAPESAGPGAGAYALGGVALLATGGAGVVVFRRTRKES